MEEYVIQGDGGFVCILCHDYKPRVKHLVIRHLEMKHFHHSVSYNGEQILLCKKLCKKVSHYHCICGCERIFDKRLRLVSHLNSKSSVEVGISFSDTIENDTVQGDDPANIVDEMSNSSRYDNGSIEENAILYKEEVVSRDVEGLQNFEDDNGVHFEREVVETRVKCSKCDTLTLKKNLKVHMKRKHNLNYNINHCELEGSCVDEKNGIFLVSRSIFGIPHPVHVQKFICGNKPPIILCESTTCENQKIIAGISGKPYFECEHLRSVPYCAPSPTVYMDDSILDVLIGEKRINPETKKMCLRQKHQSESWGVELVNAMVNSSNRWVFISVWVDKVAYYSRLSRVVLTFDKLNFKLVCNCTRSSRIPCMHKPIAKWYLRCIHPNLFLPLDDTCPTSLPTPCTLIRQYGWNVDYQYDCKLIPFDPSKGVLVERFDPGLVLVPSEECCVQCSGPLTLESCKGEPKLLTRFGFVKVQNVVFKHCSHCSLDYYYSDVNEGVFNFNNNFFISIDLLIWLRNAVLEHIALSREITLIEKQYRINIRHDLVRRCFYKFLSLIDDTDSFHCYLCGHHPVILTFDVSRKCAFKMENPNQPLPGDEKVNAKQFWDNIRKHVISESSTPSIHILPSVNYWAPYIGEHCRSSDFVYNTEFLKGARDNGEQEFLECLSEESLESLLDTDLPTLKELCEQCGIKGNKLSRMNCIVRLKDALKDKVRIDKFFFKLWNSSGGLLTGTCPHGVVYAFKSLLMPESPRDIGDVLLSMKFPPTIVISDIPHMVAGHVNRRSENFFYPHSGRVVEPSETNIKMAEDGNFIPISFPWLNRRMEKATANLSLNGMSVHPVTLVHQRLSLYDKFHQNNTTQRKEFLRKTAYVRELDGVVTETAEQLNSFLSKSLYFLDGLSPIHHLLVIKALFSLRNAEINSKIVGSKPHTSDVLGRVMYIDQMSNNQYHSTDTVPTQLFDVHPSVANHHSTSLSPPTNTANNESFGTTAEYSKRQLEDPCIKESKVMKFDVDIQYSDKDIFFFDVIKLLYKGLHNPLNNCWFNAVMFAVRNTLGSSRLYEDEFVIGSDDGNDSYCVDKSLRPIVASLSLMGSAKVLQKDVLVDCLKSYFKGSSTNIGQEQDPYDFFLSSLGLIDSNSVYMFHFPTIFEIKIRSTVVCLSCDGISSSMSNGVSSFMSNESCLSLSIDKGIDSDLLELVKKYFEDEVLEGRKCENEKCGQHNSAVAKRMVNAPDVLAIQIKRYDRNFLKSTELVSLDRLLDLSDVMDVKNSEYVLRAVVTHKGSTMTSGHYTTTLFEGSRAICVELDGTQVLLLRQMEDICSGGYLLLYENKLVMDKLIDMWFPLSLFVSLLVSYIPLGAQTLNACLLKFWDVLLQSNLELCSMILEALAAMLARNFTMTVKDFNKYEEIITYLLELLGVKEQGNSFFMGSFYCQYCKLPQKHTAKYFVLNCADISINSILTEVADNFQDEECYDCERLLEFDGTPIFLSDLLFLSTIGDHISLDDVPGSMRVVNSFSFCGSLGQNQVVVCKNERYLVASSDRRLLEQYDLSSINGERIVMLKGENVLVDFQLDVTHKPCLIKTYSISSEEIKIKLDACLQNFIADVRIVTMVQNTLCSGIVGSEFIQSFFVSVFDSSVLYLSYRSPDELITASIGSILTAIKVKRFHKFILFNLGDAFCLFQFGKKDVYNIGKLIPDAAVKKLLHIFDIMNDIYSPYSSYALIHVSSFSLALESIHYIKIAYCVIMGLDVEVEDADFCTIAVVALYLKIPQNDLVSMDDFIVKQCPFAHCVPLKPAVTTTKILLPGSNNLFEKPVSAALVLNRVKDNFLVYESGVLRDDLCLHVLTFLMERKEMIRAYYFLDAAVLDENDRKSITTLLNLRKYRHNHERLSFMVQHEKIMLGCIPAMVFRCFQVALKVLLSNKSNTPLDNGISQYGSFSIFDFIDIFVVKKLLVEYVACSLGVDVVEVQSRTGCVGEDIIY